MVKSWVFDAEFCAEDRAASPARYHLINHLLARCAEWSVASSGDCSEERTRAGGIDDRVRCYQDERSGGTRGSQIRVQHSSVLKSRYSIWFRYKIADMALCSRCMHAYLNAMMLGVAIGSPHAHCAACYDIKNSRRLSAHRSHRPRHPPFATRSGHLCGQLACLRVMTPRIARDAAPSDAIIQQLHCR